MADPDKALGALAGAVQVLASRFGWTRERIIAAVDDALEDLKEHTEGRTP
jgi:hypothetical protein